MKYSYWATCPKCKQKFHVYKADKKPKHTGMIDGIFGVIEECVFCLGIIERPTPIDLNVDIGSQEINTSHGAEGDKK